MLISTSTHGDIEAVTVRELFEWAQANRCEDAVIRYYDGGLSYAVVTEIEGVLSLNHISEPVVSIVGMQV